MDQTNHPSNIKWLSQPREVETQLLEWSKTYPDKLQLDWAKQFTGDTVYAATVSGAWGKATKNLLIAVPHAHEPAGTAASMDFLCQLLTGRTLDGHPAAPACQEFLNHLKITIIPIANPFGRKRAPVDCWDGSVYDNEQFEYIMVGRLREGQDFKLVNAFWHSHPIFDQRIECLKEIGIVWEQISAHKYAEPHFFKGTTWWKLIDRLSDEIPYHFFAELHQGMENWEEYDTLAIYPNESWIPQSALDFSEKVHQHIREKWIQAGANPHPGDPDYYQRAGRSCFRPDEPSERRRFSIDWLTEKCGTPFITVEVQNNNSRTPRDEQLKYAEAAIEACAEVLL